MQPVKTKKKLSRADKKQIEAAIARANRTDKKGKSAQDSIPYERMWPDGICRVSDSHYTKTIQFQDINYQLSQNEDKTAIFEGWCDFLNYFDSSIHFQLSFLNLAASEETFAKDPPHNCAQPRHIIPADPNFEKKRNSSALFAREINLVTQPSFDCEQGINSQVQTACSNADAIFPVLGIVFCKNERFSLLRKTHVPLWNEPRISHVRLP